MHQAGTPAPNAEARPLGALRVSHRTEPLLARAGVEFLQVQMLSAGHPDEGYQKTRAHYLDCGFRPLQKFPE